MTSTILLGVYAYRVHRKRQNKLLSIETETSQDYSDMPPRARLLVDSVLSRSNHNNNNNNDDDSSLPSSSEDSSSHGYKNNNNNSNNNSNNGPQEKEEVGGRSGALQRFLHPLTSSSSSSPTKKSSSTSTAIQLLAAIQNNNPSKVLHHLSHGADPNALLFPHYAIPIDLIFLWKRLFGESVTSIHVAIINVYHRHAFRRRELEKSLEILKLLLLYGGNNIVTTRTTNMFLTTTTTTHQRGATQMSPMDLTKGLKRLALFSTGNAEAAMDAAIGMFYENNTRSNRSNNNNQRRKQQQQEKPSIPFNMMSEEDVTKMSNFLFAKVPEGLPSEPIRSLEEVSLDEEYS